MWCQTNYHLVNNNNCSRSNCHWSGRVVKALDSGVSRERSCVFRSCFRLTPHPSVIILDHSYKALVSDRVILQLTVPYKQLMTKTTFQQQQKPSSTVVCCKNVTYVHHTHTHMHLHTHVYMHTNYTFTYTHTLTQTHKERVNTAQVTWQRKSFSVFNWESVLWSQWSLATASVHDWQSPEATAQSTEHWKTKSTVSTLNFITLGTTQCFKQWLLGLVSTWYVQKVQYVQPHTQW